MSSHEPDRRTFLFSATPLLLWAATSGGRVAAGGEDIVSVERFDDFGNRLGLMPLQKVVKTDDEWRTLLPPDAFDVTRKEGTEPPFSGAYWNEHRLGLYRCICCGTALFDAATKFKSGTGWPSFWQPIAKANVVESEDTSYDMLRIAVSCRLCDAHLGHVFDDGPKPTGLRYCINSVALRFAPRDKAA